MKGNSFVNLEELKLKTLQEKIANGLDKFQQEPDKHWILISFPKPLLKKMSNLIDREMSQKVIKTGISSQACPNCKSNVSDHYCSVCGQKLSY